MTNLDIQSIHVPSVCTLPTAEQPLRVAEFNDVFALVRATERPMPTRLLLTLQPPPGQTKAISDLAARESTCCSFFQFTVREEDGGVLLEIIVPLAQLGVLDALAEHADRVVRMADHA